MTDANGLNGDSYTRVVLPPVDGDAWQFGTVQPAEACTELGAEDEGFGAIEGALSWPGILSAVVVILAVLSAIFWPH